MSKLLRSVWDSAGSEGLTPNLFEHVLVENAAFGMGRFVNFAVEGISCLVAPPPGAAKGGCGGEIKVEWGSTRLWEMLRLICCDL